MDCTQGEARCSCGVEGRPGCLRFGWGELGDITSFPVGLRRPGNQPCSGNAILWNAAAEEAQLVPVSVTQTNIVSLAVSSSHTLRGKETLAFCVPWLLPLLICAFPQVAGSSCEGNVLAIQSSDLFFVRMPGNVLWPIYILGWTVCVFANNSPLFLPLIVF